MREASVVNAGARAERFAGRWLPGVLLAGFALRVGVRLAGGEEAFLANGYDFHLELADSFLAGDGLCYRHRVSCALRMPGYTVFLTPFVWSGQLYPAVVLAQALMGSLSIWAAWWIGRELFSAGAGLWAAIGTALNPYAVVHDTALQDTVLLNLLAMAAIVALLRAHRADRPSLWVWSGALLASAVLTSARLTLFVPAVLLWILLASAGTTRARFRRAGLVALPILVLVGGWGIRNWQVVGAPVLTTDLGESLFRGNSDLTFTHFPDESIDLAYADYARVTPVVAETLQRLEGHDVARDAALRQFALAYITANPGRVVWGGLRKLWVVASAQLSPRRAPLVQWSYRLLFLPAHLLAVVALAAARSRWRPHLLVAALVMSFAITTAVFWAHTSHKSYLDPIIFVYAAAGAATIWPRDARRTAPGGRPQPVVR